MKIGPDLKKENALQVRPLATECWPEFGNFFDKPISNSSIYQWDETARNPDGSVRMQTQEDNYLPEEGPLMGTEDEAYRIRYVSFSQYLSVHRTDKREAIAILKKNLLRLKDAEENGYRTVAFLLKPCLIPGVREVKDGEVSDCTFYKGPGKRTWIAFCFPVCGYKDHDKMKKADGSYKSMQDSMEEIGVFISRQEGYVGDSDCDDPKDER